MVASLWLVWPLADASVAGITFAGAPSAVDRLVHETSVQSSEAELTAH